VLGTFSTLVEAPYIELLGHAGFDFVITDCEESPGDSFGMQLEDLLRAAEAAGIATLVRPVENRAGAINRALNAGAEGVYVPHVRTVADCEAVVAAVLYPPLGRRGAAPVVRAAGFGTEGWDAYHARVNAQNLAMIMIEDLEGVENIDEIVKVPGLAGVLVGTWDLAVEAGVADYGPPPPQVMAHVARVFEATVGAGLIMSAHCWSADAARKYQELGARILTVSLDSTLLIAALRQLEAEGDALRS
jgi:4-hydroxy-2-oxoheptanedioate aldolase